MHEVPRLSLIIMFFLVTICSFMSGCGVEGSNQVDSTDEGSSPRIVTFSGHIAYSSGARASGVTIIYSITGDSTISDSEGRYVLASVPQSSVGEFIIEDSSFSGGTSVSLVFTEAADEKNIDFVIDADLKNISASTSAVPPSLTPNVPADTPIPQTPSGPFDLDGNTSSFGIPSGASGNAHRGKKVYFGQCSGCHSSIIGKGDSYSSLKNSLSKPPMNDLHIANNEVADLVAYLNFIR